ncbi:hypothetical protein WKW77_32790 [Variovorax ureilyticus]|uniref:Cell envelope biogenesis protein TolA n=1 Tax=Variovorax ureilyticus TaxID=1836198 RepID=A0ABU8VQX5_9BURK
MAKVIDRLSVDSAAVSSPDRRSSLGSFAYASQGPFPTPCTSTQPYGHPRSRRKGLASWRNPFASADAINPLRELIMKKPLLVVAFAVTCFAMSGANALTQHEYKVAKEKIEADYKLAKAKCDALQDNAKDVCMQEAKGTEKVAKAELEQQYKPSAAHARKVAEEKADMNYEVAKEKCDDQSGDAKSACVNQAKADHEKAKAHIKSRKG